MNLKLNSLKKIHFIGIGGAGMSTLAEILKLQYFQVSGFDDVSTKVTHYLLKQGVEFDTKFSTQKLDQADLVIISAAIAPEHFQLVRAIKLKKKIIKRAELLAQLLQLQQSIAVAGTHGKTTTSHLLACVLEACGEKPLLLAGGNLLGQSTGGRLGNGKLAVGEADEYDKSFLHIHSDYSIVNNLEEDHLECYQDREDLLSSFVQFMNQTTQQVFISADDLNLKSMLPHITTPFKTFGLNSKADYRASGLSFSTMGTSFSVYYQNNLLLNIHSSLWGEHNLRNALGTIAFAHQAGFSLNDVAQGLSQFVGVERRLQYWGCFSGIDFYDDYAHHPTEIFETVKSVRSLVKKRLILLFQPHLYSRTQTYCQQFANALMQGDQVFLAPIYPAREKPIKGVSSKLILEAMVKNTHQNAFTFSDNASFIKVVSQELKEGDLCLIMGAGDINLLAEEVLNVLKS